MLSYTIGRFTGRTFLIAVSGVVIAATSISTNVKLFACAPVSVAGKDRVTLTISDGDGRTVTPIYGSSYSNLEKLCRVETTPQIGSRIANLGLRILGYTVGSDIQWFHIYTEKGQEGEGFNAWPREVEARNRNIEEVYGGALKPRRDEQGRTYPYWADFLHTLDLADSAFLMCPNIYSAQLAYDGTSASLRGFWREFDRMVKDVVTAGQSIPIVQLGAESQLYRDLFSGAEDYRGLCEVLIPGIRQRLPGAAISADGSNRRNKKWDDEVASIPGVDAIRLYLQILGHQFTDYSDMRRRINIDLPQIVDEFVTDYPDKRIVFLQMAIKNRHPYHHRVAHGLYLAELYVRLAKLNLEKDDVILAASQMNLRHLFSKHFTPTPPYFGMLAVKNIWGGVVQHCRVEGADLVTIAVRQGDGHHVVVINPTDKPVTIDEVIVDGRTRRDYIVSGYYGKLPSSTTVSKFDSLKMPRYSWASVLLP